MVSTLVFDTRRLGSNPSTPGRWTVAGTDTDKWVIVLFPRKWGVPDALPTKLWYFALVAEWHRHYTKDVGSVGSNPTKGTT